MTEFIPLAVAKVERETKQCVSVVFEVPSGLRERFRWTPGQHVQLKIDIDGRQETRRYSISSPLGEPLRVTVKSHKRGKVSRHINKNLKVGDFVLVAPPSGQFTLAPSIELRRSYYFFAAGSGITPIFAMLQSVLQQEPQSFCYLLYGNKDAKQTIFCAQLQHLQELYAHRLVIQHCHSSPSWLADSPWRSHRITPQAAQEFVQEYPPTAQDCHYYLCGPGSFLKDVKCALQDIDVPSNRIHLESFGSPAGSQEQGAVAAEMRVVIDGSQQAVSVTQGQTLLAALQASKVVVPHSCEGGVCGTCVCRLVKGKVKMENNLALNERQVADGQILACQSIPQTNQIEIVY